MTMRQLQHSLQRLLLLTILITTTRAFPDRAGGSCPGGRPAVGGIHLSYGTDGTRHVQSGNLRDSHLQLYVDGTDLSTLSSSTKTIRTGVQHTIEVVSSVTARPFKGALIRMEPITTINEASDFVLLPMIHTGHAEICTEPAQGVSHVDNEPKAVVSAGFTAFQTGNYEIDVTIVETNDVDENGKESGSVYWYSHFVIQAAEPDHPLQPLVSAEEAAVETTTTPLPPCHVCSIGTQIVLPGREIVFDGVSMTCRDLEIMGLEARLGDSVGVCSRAQAVVEHLCLCSSVTEDSPPCHVCGVKGGYSNEPEAKVLFAEMGHIPTCGELVEHGAQGFIPPSHCESAQELARASCACSSQMVPTFTPTVTALPTYSTPCFVCGPGQAVQGDSHVMLGDVVVSCQDLGMDGAQGYIPPDLCSEAQKVASEFCECMTVNVPSPAVPSTFEPTLTAYPTFAETCEICPYGQVVTKPDQTITVDGGVGTCSELETEGATGFVAPSICPDAQATARRDCGCAPAPAPATTVDGTLYPTYQTTCYVCGSEHATVTNMDGEVVVGGDRGTCKELQQVALSRLLPGDMCDEAQREAARNCKCAGGAVLPTTPTMQPTVTMYPTFSETCQVCPTGMQVTALAKSVVMDGISLTCEELEEAGKEHVIPPLFCPTAQSTAQKFCDCASSPTRNVPSPGLHTFSPTKTPLPTVTFTPTFSQVCEICPGDSFITEDHALVSIDSMLVTCRELQEAARERMIPPSICPTAQNKAAVACGCRKPAHAILLDEPTLSPVWTFQPTITAEPTHTVSPTYAAHCDICGMDRTVSKPHQIIQVAGIVLTCRDLEGAGTKSLIPPYHCSESRQIAHEQCGCKHIFAPAPSTIHTFRPTITSEPTRTMEPTHTEACSLCPPGGRISMLKSLVAIEGYLLTCTDLEEFASHKRLSSELCSEAQNQARESCGCVTLAADMDAHETSGTWGWRSNCWGLVLFACLSLYLCR